MHGFRLLPYACGAPEWNMAADEALLRLAREPTLRFYGWDPAAISLGRFQGRREDLSPLLGSGMPVVRRMTGGGAIVHASELTYSLTLPCHHPVLRGVARRASYSVLHAPIARTLERLGVPVSARPSGETGSHTPLLCFLRATDLDLLAAGRKLLGSAQRRTGARLLQHGSLLIHRHPLQPGTAALSDHLDPSPGPAALAEHLARAFEDLLGPARPGALTREERAAAQKAAPGYRFPQNSAAAGGR